MAIARTQAEKDIARFIRKVKKHIRVHSVILFGSRKNGAAGKWSDIDLAVISDDFKDMKPIQRMVFLGKIAWKTKVPIIEAFGYTVKEYDNVSQFDFLYEIKKTGKKLRVA